MKMHEKTASKRYCIFAKRRNEKAWTEWTASNDLNVAMEQVAKVRTLGFLGKVKDRRKRKTITSD